MLRGQFSRTTANEQLLRPYGIVLEGHLQLGLEVLLNGDTVVEVRSHTGIPEPYVLSPAFVNAHSHLEYRHLQGVLNEKEWWAWLQNLIKFKFSTDPLVVIEGVMQAAKENRATGIALIAEHSDIPVSADALTQAEIGGTIFQEIVTIFDTARRKSRLQEVQVNAETSKRAFIGDVFPSPHAYYSVDNQTLKSLAESGEPFSMHLAETPYESQYTLDGSGTLGLSYAERGIAEKPTGKRVLPTVVDLGLARPGAQFVHCCDLNQEEVELLAFTGATVAHCPRSNRNLGCPIAPVQAMLAAGINVGLGMDSAASSGPIDMFKEMRAALEVSMESGSPLHAEQVWNMATEMGARSFGNPQKQPEWSVSPKSSVPLIKLHIPDAHSTEELIERGTPELVEWVNDAPCTENDRP